MKSFVRVVLSVATTLFGLLLVTFIISRMLPADPVLAIVGDHASESTIEQARIHLGLDKPLLVQFGIYLVNVLQGDLGNSIRTGAPIAEELLRVFPATLELATLGTLIGIILGIPLGVWAAVRKDSYVDHVVRFFGLIGYSVPIFWLGLMGLLLFYAKLGWVAGPGRLDVTYSYLYTPVTGIVLLDTAMQGQWDAFWDAVSHVLLPACLLGYFSLAYISRMTRSFMLNELAQEYVIAARVKGLSEMRVIWRHALRNAAVPLVTVIALSYANLLEGSVLTETVFAWPGLGQYITNSLQNADMNAVLGGTLVIGTVFVLLNLVSDLLYRLLDPRTR
jgi:peptide/nickel transport system permease protein